jgi:hypothetical protein
LQTKEKVSELRRANKTERTFEFECLCFSRLSEHPLRFRRGNDWGEPEDKKEPNRHIDALGDPELSQFVRTVRDNSHVEWVKVHDRYVVVRLYGPLYWVTVDHKVQVALRELRMNAGLDGRLAATP